MINFPLLDELSLIKKGSLLLPKRDGTIIISIHEKLDEEVVPKRYSKKDGALMYLGYYNFKGKNVRHYFLLGTKYCYCDADYFPNTWRKPEEYVYHTFSI